MEVKKVYPRSMGAALQVINDLVKLQNGKLTYSDSPDGKIFFCVEMYDSKLELQFIVEKIEENHCSVNIVIEQAAQGDEKMI